MMRKINNINLNKQNIIIMTTNLIKRLINNK